MKAFASNGYNHLGQFRVVSVCIYVAAGLAGGHASSLGRRHDRISHGTLSSWISLQSLPRGMEPRQEAFIALPGDPSVLPRLFQKHAMLTFINQLYSLEDHKGRRGPCGKSERLWIELRLG